MFGRSSLVGFALLSLGCGAAASSPAPLPPIGVIFDTDMGNDIDDALALGILHALESRGECRLLAVTITKDEAASAPFCDLVNTFYGRGDIPIGVVRKGMTPEASTYTGPVVALRDGGAPLFAHDLVDAQTAPEATSLLRRILNEQPDQSVVMVQVGFSTNLARLLESPADAASPLPGRELVARKCRLLSMMAGWFGPSRDKEYNIVIDIPAATKVLAEWPAPIIVSGFEIGRAIRYPAASIEQDYRYAPNHPLKLAYERYMRMPYDRECWDLTSVLHAVRPERGYFGLSAPGTVTLDDRGVTQFTPDEKGKHRYLTVSPEQIERVREALVQLASQPPTLGNPAKTK